MWAGKINFLVRLGSAPQIESFAVSAKEDESWGDCYTTTSKDSSLDEWATQALSLGTGSLDGTFTYHKNSYRVVFNEHGSLFIYSEKPLADGFITLVDSLLS